MSLKCVFAVCGAALLLAAPVPAGQKDKEIRDVVLEMRKRVPDKDASFVPVVYRQKWDATNTAVIVCDMWDSHHCLNAVRRVEEVAPRMNKVLEKTRKLGMFVIHAPSSCMAHYKDHPARKRAQAAPAAKSLPKDIASWCYKIPSEDKGVYPLDQSDGGCDTDPAEQKAWVEKLKAMGRKPGAPWLSQIDVLRIDADRDAISDSGVEIWNLLEEHNIHNVILVGVHTNMCVLGRPFGLRQLAKNGKNVVLMRDMTDTMYNPARWPHVSHFQGTDLIVHHIEKFVCPTTTSDQLLGGEPFRFKGDVRKRAVVAIGEAEYDTKTTLPLFAYRVLHEELGFDITVLQGDTKKHVIPGLAEALAKADLLVLSARRQALPAKDLEAVKAYLAAGKPLVAIRTSSHAFDAKGKGPQGHAEWPKFDPEVLGGNYRNHYPEGPQTTAKPADGAGEHPILLGVKTPFTSAASLYKTGPLAAAAKPLLVGTIPDKSPEPLAWTHTYKKARVFYTSLGHKSDFSDPSFLKLMHNGVRWASDMRIGLPPAPKTGALREENSPRADARGLIWKLSWADR